MQDITETIKSFKESTFLEESNRFPGLVYSAGARVDQLSDQQLIFQREVLTRYKNDFISEDTKNVDESDLDYTLKAIENELILRENKLNSVKWEYNEAPYFTVQEINTILEDGSMISDRRHKLVHGEIIAPSTYGKKIKDLEQQLKDAEDPEEIEYIKNMLISLGWNPEVEYSTENAVKAIHRLEKIYTKEMNEFCTFIDISDDIRNMKDYSFHESDIKYSYKPVYIYTYENGSVKLSSKAEKITLTEEPLLEAIYRIFLNEDTADAIINYKEIFEEEYTDNEVLFALPSNYTCYRAVKNICEAYNLLSRPVISRVYTFESMEDPDYDTINKFTTAFSERYDNSKENYRIYSSAIVLE